jgi:hypothetical protein
VLLTDFAEMATFFNHTKNFRDGAERFVAFEIEDVKSLLERLASGKTIDPDRADQNVVLARDWIQHVVEKAGAQQLPLEMMKKELESLVDDDRLMLLLRYYQLFSKKLITSQDRSPVVPLHLTDTNWRLDLQLAGSDLNKVIEPAAFLHFSLTSGQHADTSQVRRFLRDTNRLHLLIVLLTQLDPSFTLEFSKTDLYNFLCELDDIQGQLDDVS